MKGLLQGVYRRRWHKFLFYLKHIHLGLLPHSVLARNINAVLAELLLLPKAQQDDIHLRLHYYNRLHGTQTLSGDAVQQVGTFKKNGFSAYYYDLAALLPYFSPEQRFICEFGDVTHVPKQAAFVKSRPIGGDNQHSVLLKLDSVRHFYLCPDPYEFTQKHDKLVWRGAAHQAHRKRFLEKYHQHPLCDVGCVHKDSVHQPYHRDFMSVEGQLRYRYILSIEGNDVATNLKWILASRSLCLMTTPKYETWLMEGLLQPHVHYVPLADDYVDLDEKLNFYRQHTKAAEKITLNARKWMHRFADPKIELMLSLLVMQRYFQHTR